MLIHTHDNGFDHHSASEITPRAVYEQRRALLRLMAGGAQTVRAAPFQAVNGRWPRVSMT